MIYAPARWRFSSGSGIGDRLCVVKLERVNGIEPSSSAWKAVALPLSYTRPTTADLKDLLRRCQSFGPAFRWTSLRRNRPGQQELDSDLAAVLAAPDYPAL